MQGKNNYVLTLGIILEDSIELVIIFGIIQADYRNLNYIYNKTLIKHFINPVKYFTQYSSSFLKEYNIFTLGGKEYIRSDSDNIAVISRFILSFEFTALEAQYFITNGICSLVWKIPNLSGFYLMFCNQAISCGPLLIASIKII